MKTTKHYSLPILITVMLIPYDINAQTWEEIGFKLPDGDTASYSTSITFANKDTGWVFTHTGNTHKLFKTINGGQSWQMIKTLDGDYSAYFATAIFSRKPDFFYMMTSDPQSSIGNFGRYTTDGGVTWDSTALPDVGFKLIDFYA